MSYKVCIPTAGTGSRLGDLTRYLNKSLVSIANRPTICHLIEQFPSDARFVIALGHKGNLVQEFLELAYPDRHFEFALVEPYEGEGSGLGLSLIACKQYLQEPFVFISCDTLVDQPIPAPDRNWMGYSKTQDLDPYRTIEVASDKVVGICEKGEGKVISHKAYIGLSGILDYQAFWLQMEAGGSEVIQNGEAHGLRAILPKGVGAISFTWYDTGNVDALKKARDTFREVDEPNILEKANEAIWFVGDQVIKYSDDQKFISNRVMRVNELGEFVPKITGSTDHMYRYSKVNGKVFSQVANPLLFQKLLSHASHFWKLKSLNKKDHESFRHTCRRFYRDKTYDRVELFYKNFSQSDIEGKINGVEMPPLKDLLDAIDWDWLADGLPGRFHGDFHFENILWSSEVEKFTFLDWRQDFGGDLSVGDMYYDFAKLLHGLIVNHEIIAHDSYEVKWLQKDITFDFHRKQSLVKCENYFISWLTQQGRDVKKTIILTALIYLNIAALHHYPYSLLLYGLGKSMLFEELSK